MRFVGGIHPQHRRARPQDHLPTNGATAANPPTRQTALLLLESCATDLRYMRYEARFRAAAVRYVSVRRGVYASRRWRSHVAAARTTAV
jgi:hypothetical protein